uniref:SHSP domain-containing protein n=1 Tax=Trichobilharzia regenti TaxID=157069 RepID=A0AA85JTA8_TRIRE|nr:unnamed protein product [Trichobilharzia regenti]CAH8825325.1 unnamed protein product [Trichobilharzia regenti]
MNTACVSHPSLVKDLHDTAIIHIEMSVDPVFKKEQISVKFEPNRIIVTGRYDEKQSPGDFVEFKKSFEITEVVDQSCLSVQISGATLVVEAPIIEDKN